MERFKREISRRNRRKNLYKHQGVRTLSKIAIKSAEALAWPLGTPKLSDLQDEINSKDKPK